MLDGVSVMLFSKFLKPQVLQELKRLNLVDPIASEQFRLPLTLTGSPIPALTPLMS